MSPRWIILQIGYALVEGEQNTVFGQGDLYEYAIFGSDELLVEYSFCLVTGAAEINCQLKRQLLIELDPHDALIGVSRSLCASSAAYASAARTWAAVRDG